MLLIIARKKAIRVVLKRQKKQLSMRSFLNNETTPLDKQVINAEVMIPNFLSQHNLPLATSDHLSSLFKEAFPDNKIAKNYAARRTRTGAIINESLGPDCRNYILLNIAKPIHFLGQMILVCKK